MGLLEQIIQAGIVGCGGAGFPTGKKLDCEVEWLIVNGAECEPLLKTDHYLMRHHAEEIVTAAEAAGALVKAQQVVIALKESYAPERAALEKVLSDRDSVVSLCLLDGFYPAGDEQMLVFEVTGRVVPPGGIPLEAGVVVSNVATLKAIYDAMSGKPLTEKYVTVTGEVKTPCIVKAPIGTGFSDCIRLAGGTKEKEYSVINGGPMMGRIMTKSQAADAVVTKTTSGFIVLPEDHYLVGKAHMGLERMRNLAASACIQCSCCTQLCPRNLIGHPLEPHKIMRKFATGADIADLLDDADVREAAICCQCGICELYACPMGLNPRRINGKIKDALNKAGIRYERKGEVWTADPDRGMRKVPAKRAAARAGVLPYYDCEPETLLCAQPERVKIPLKQNIGAPSEPVVSEGDRVKAGQLIARCQAGKLGADLHAGISGVVKKINDCIVIEGRC